MSTFIKVIIFIFVLYIGILIGIPWAKYFIYKNSTFKVLNISQTLTQREILKLLLNKAEELNINVKRSNIQIVDYQNGKKYIIKYKDEVKFPFIENKLIFDYEIKKFRYNPGVQYD